MTAPIPIPMSSPMSANNCRFHGKEIKDGESHTVLDSWPMTGCVKCTCRRGTCEYDTNAECPDQGEKESCIDESGDILPRGGILQHGQSYTNMAPSCRQDPGGFEMLSCCRECVCNDGVSLCSFVDSGRCEMSCYHNGKEIKHGQSYKDDCNTCHCYNGMATCTLMGCSPEKPIGEY